MVKRCINPECHNEFRQWNTGDLYALERGSDDTRFFWLCSDCAQSMAVIVDALGAVSVRRQFGVMMTTPANHNARLRLISGHGTTWLPHRADTFSTWSAYPGEHTGLAAPSADAA